MGELERRLEHPSSEARPSAAVLARWERGRAKYPAILLAPIQRSAWKGNSAKFALTEFSALRVPHSPGPMRYAPRPGWGVSSS